MKHRRFRLLQQLLLCSFRRLYSLLLFLFAFSVFSFVLEAAIYWNQLLLGPKKDMDSCQFTSFEIVDSQDSINYTDVEGSTIFRFLRKYDTLTVQAFTDKRAPTVEVNTAVTESTLNIARIRRILDHLGMQIPDGRVSVLQGWMSSKSKGKICSKSDKNLQTNPKAAGSKKKCHLTKWQKKDTCSRTPPLGE